MPDEVSGSGDDDEDCVSLDDSGKQGSDDRKEVTTSDELLVLMMVTSLHQGTLQIALQRLQRKKVVRVKRPQKLEKRLGRSQ